MSFLNPLYLWALLGLAIPIAIHLWSKKEGKTIKIGSIKLLNEADSRQSSSISLNELLLLLLRLLIITLLVLVMAEPHIKRETTNTPITYIIEPSLATNKEIAPIIDSLKTESSVKLLENGFPELTDDIFERTDFKTPNYWQLAKAMEAIHTDSIVVFTNAFASGLKGKRPIVNKNIEWIIIDETEPINRVLEAIKKSESVQLLSLVGDDKALSFKKENISPNSITQNETKDSIQITSNEKQEWIALRTEETIKVLLFYDEELTNESVYIEAGLNAISKHIETPIDINKTQDSNNFDISVYEKIVWLSKKLIPVSSARFLIYKPDELASMMITESELNNEYYLTQRLTSENIIEDHLTEQFLSWLNLHPNLEKKIKSLDKRTIDKAELLPIFKNVKKESKYIETLTLTKWLLIVLALLLVFERIVAYLRKQ